MFPVNKMSAFMQLTFFSLAEVSSVNFLFFMQKIYILCGIITEMIMCHKEVQLLFKSRVQSLCFLAFKLKGG